MKKAINSTITNLLSPLYRILLREYYGTYFVSPKPKYLSQFARIYPSSLDINDPLMNEHDIKKYGAKNSKEFSFWAWRNCGIVCVKMILDARKKGTGSSIMELTRQGIVLGGYITYLGDKFIDKGWFHFALKLLLEKHELNAQLKKWQTPESVARDVLNNKYVILSVKVPGRSHIQEDGSFGAKQNAKYGGHLLLVTGVKMHNKNIVGFYAHDPRGLKNYQKDTWIPRQTFIKIFSSRTIVAK